MGPVLGLAGSSSGLKGGGAPSTDTLIRPHGVST